MRDRAALNKPFLGYFMVARDQDTHQAICNALFLRERETNRYLSLRLRDKIQYNDIVLR